MRVLQLISVSISRSKSAEYNGDWPTGKLENFPLDSYCHWPVRPNYDAFTMMIPIQTADNLSLALLVQAFVKINLTRPGVPQQSLSRVYFLIAKPHQSVWLAHRTYRCTSGSITSVATGNNDEFNWALVNRIYILIVNDM